MHQKKYDLVAVGELLIDLISEGYATSLTDAAQFRRYYGGSPANLASNMAWLGKRTALVATVGNDAFGDYLLQQLRQTPVATDFIHRTAVTTLIVVTRSQSVGQFEAYRSADAHITPAQLPTHLLTDTAILHTTCFALSLQPARNTILQAADYVAANGGQLSIDLNYAEKIGPDRATAQATIAHYVSNGALVKVSDVDWERIYNTPFQSAEATATYFIGLGAKQVCVTMGERGSFAMDAAGNTATMPVRPIEVRDTTGAGDAFWSGYLTAWLNGRTLHGCLSTGRSMAERKLVQVGQIMQPVQNIGEND